MRPEQKSDVIWLIQYAGNSVAMVGDGANDCSAIKQSDVGISFVEGDGAFAAPFSSISPSLKCVENVLNEGRANLSNAC